MDDVAIAAGIIVSPGCIIEVLWTSSNSKIFPTAALIKALSNGLNDFLSKRFRQLPFGNSDCKFLNGSACFVKVPAIE